MKDKKKKALSTKEVQGSRQKTVKYISLKVKKTNGP